MELAEAGILPEEPKRNMVFHCFLCFFLLWLSAVGSFLSAVECFARPEPLDTSMYRFLVRDVLSLNDEQTELVAVPFFRGETTKKMLWKKPGTAGSGGKVSEDVTGTLGRIILFSAADGIVCTGLPSVLGMTVTGSFTADGIIRIALAVTAVFAAELLIRRKRLGALLVQIFYLVNTVLLIILMFRQFSFPYLVGLFADLLMAGFTTIYYVRRRHQMTYMTVYGEEEDIPDETETGEKVTSADP